MLNALLNSGLWERGEIKAFYNRLSQILRRFLERRNGIPATYLTTQDLVRQIRRLGMAPSQANASRQVLQTSDLVKFAMWKPRDTEKDRDVAKTRQIFERQQQKAPESSGKLQKA